jgi:hypothetical protein
VSTTTVRTLAHFNAPSRRVEGGYAIYPDALLFELGAWPDKAFSLTDAEMDAAIVGFTPVGGSIEHSAFLKGRALNIRSIRRDAANPKRLRGEVAVPLGLDAILDDAERGFSAEWDRTTKRLVGGALTVNPRIKGASLVAKFAATTAEATDDPVVLRETIAALAAFCACQAEAQPVPFTTLEPEAPMPSKRELDIARAQEMSDEEYDAATIPDDDDAGDDVDETLETGTSDFSAREAEYEARFAAIEAERYSGKVAQCRERSATFAATMKGQNRIAPYEEDTVASVMLNMMITDVEAGLAGKTVAFSLGKKEVTGSMEQMYASSIKLREVRNYGPQINSAAPDGQVLPHFSGGDAPETPEQRRARIDDNLKDTPEGRAVLAARGRNGAAAH